MHQHQHAVYIGAGLDIRPIRALPNIEKFIYVDSRPFTQQPPHHFQYETTFISDFTDKIEVLNYIPTTTYTTYTTNTDKPVLPTCIEYSNKDKTLEYYFNSSFPITKNKTLEDAVWCPRNCRISSSRVCHRHDEETGSRGLF